MNIELNLFLIFLIFISAAIHIVADYKFKKIIYFTKPIPMLIIIGIFLQNFNDFSSSKIIILLGFIFSLAGDIFLINKYQFVKGLFLFLIAHIFYIIFVLTTSQFHFSLILFAISILVFSIFYFIIIININSNKSFVIIYACIILFLLWQSCEQAIHLQSQTSIIFAIGIFLFVFSDLTLAYNKFVKKFNSAQLIILSTYFLAQTLILISIIN
ncbi:MAG: lysoplasmalogenase [Melioribacteraceae bacterium]